MPIRVRWYRRVRAGSRARGTQIVDQLLDIFGGDSQALGSAASVALEVDEVLVLYVAAQGVAHDLALRLAACAGERFRLGGQLIGNRY